MTHDFSASEFCETMNEISKMNLEIQREHAPHKSYERALSKCGCSFRSRQDEVSDRSHNALPSNHQKMVDFARKAARDTAILAFHDRLMEMPCLFPASSRILLSFGLTDAGNPAIDIRVDGISVHERPVTARTLAPKLIELTECLARSNEVETPQRPCRRFMISYTDRITAVSPGQALWKWLCLRHRKQALRMLSAPVAEALPEHEEFAKLMRQTPVHEVFDAPSELARALGLRCPEALLEDRDRLW